MISVVTAYYNRKKLFHNTLLSMAKSTYKDFEVIAVDDASKEEERLEDLIQEFSFLRVVRVDPKDKTYRNSCIPYNIGINKAKGDIIILQNPECMHADDVFLHVVEKLTEDNYLTMSCYSINKEMGVWSLSSLPQQIVNNYVGWYNHSKFNPCAYHFCSAITRSNMNKLGGFDERYADGIGYEDNEFLDRVRRLGLKVSIEDNITVIHQWHPKVYDLSASKLYRRLYDMNARLHRRTKKETIIKVRNSYAN